MVEKLLRRLKIAVSTGIMALTGFVGPAAASHDGLGCSVPSGLSPLMTFLHTIETIAFLAGVSIGTIGFLIAGTYLMMPGPETTTKGKRLAKNVFFGALLLFSAQLIMSFIIAQFGATICSG